MEAMSYNLPVIVSDIKENKEAIDEAGLLFKNKNINELQRQLCYLIKHKTKRDALAKKAKQKVLSNYNWDDLSSQIAAVYRDAFFNKNKKYITRKILARDYLK